MANFNESKQIIQYIRDMCLKEEPCASCDVFADDTRCEFNAYFTNCPWTGRALQWARKLEGTYITVEMRGTCEQEEFG